MLIADEAPNQRNWHYPMNFEGAATGAGRKKNKTTSAGDRWERTVSGGDLSSMTARAHVSEPTGPTRCLQAQHTPLVRLWMMTCQSGDVIMAQRAVVRRTRSSSRARRQVVAADGPIRMLTMCRATTAGEARLTSVKRNGNQVDAARMCSTTSSSRVVVVEKVVDNCGGGAVAGTAG